MSNFSMPWQIDILFSKFGWASHILSFVFNGMISPRVLLMWKFFSFFAKLTFSGKFFIALITITFHTYVNNFIFTKYLRLCNSLSNGRCVNIPTVSCGCYHCLHFTWMSLPAVFLCCTFIVVNQYFEKMPLGLIKGRKGGHTATNFAICSWTDVLTNHWQTMKGVMSVTSGIMMYICYSHGDVWLAELAERFVVYADTHS